MELRKALCLLVTLFLLTALFVGCGEKPADVTTTAGDAATTTLADEVTTTVSDGETTTLADDETTGVEDDVTTAAGEDPTTAAKDNATTTVGKNTTTGGNPWDGATTKDSENTTKKPDGTTKKPDGTTQKPATTTTKKVTTTTTKKTTTVATTTTTAQKVYGTTLYVDWNPETRVLQAVQKYSDTHDLVSIIKPIAPNEILNFVSPKLIANTKSEISSDLSKAKHWYAMPESDWLGPHGINGDWHGGSHGHGANNNPTGYTDGVVLKVNGKATNGNVGTYAGEINLSYTNYLWNSSTKKVFMTEHYSLTFDGEKWSVECNLKMLENTTGWTSYYGMQCTYGAWLDSIQYGDEEPVSIAAANGNTKASSKMCDTMILRSNKGHALEMKMDRTYGLGKGNYIQSSSAGAFTAAYPHPNGKAYFLLVNDGRNPPKNAKFMWRGTYRFFFEE